MRMPLVSIVWPSGPSVSVKLVLSGLTMPPFSLIEAPPGGAPGTGNAAIRSKEPSNEKLVKASIACRLHEMTMPTSVTTPPSRQSTERFKPPDMTTVGSGSMTVLRLGRRRWLRYWSGFWKLGLVLFATAGGECERRQRQAHCHYQEHPLSHIYLLSEAATSLMTALFLDCAIVSLDAAGCRSLPPFNYPPAKTPSSLLFTRHSGNSKVFHRRWSTLPFE